MCRDTCEAQFNMVWDILPVLIWYSRNILTLIGQGVQWTKREPSGVASLWYLPWFPGVCNVPTLGHHYITECYDDQSSQMEVIVNTSTRGFVGSDLHHSSYFIIMIHSAYLGFGSIAFRPFPYFWVILGYMLIKITKEAILGIILGGTS